MVASYVYSAFNGFRYDKTSTIIASERSGFSSGVSTLYVKKYIIFKKSLNHKTIDGTRSFSSGYYNFQWINEYSANITSEDNIYLRANLD